MDIQSVPQTLQELQHHLKQELRPNLFTSHELDLIWHAYVFALKHFPPQERRLNKPHIINALAVATLLNHYNLDAETIAASFLHGVIKNQAATLKEIEIHFGGQITHLIKGVLSIEQYSPRQGDAQKLQNLLVTIVEDVRTVLIQLANRLHLIRNLQTIPDENRKKDLAQETLDVFAPMAERLGMWEVKSELEDLSFRYSNAEAYHQIVSEIETIRAKHDQILTKAIRRVRHRMLVSGMPVERYSINGRPKHIYSIYKKMRTRKYREHGVERIYDKLGIRVIVDTIPECYAVLGVIHAEWTPIRGEFDDYIGMPRPSGYQSLHTAVRYDTGKHDVIEFQIRTREMHYEAEHGVAAHWLYKEKTQQGGSLTKRITWLRQMIEGLHHGDEPEVLQEELTTDKIYIFTPHGNIVELITGSTPIDFAYQIHTEIGHRCRGARVDGKIVPLDYQLQSQQTVEIITAKKGGPSRDWLNPNLGYTRRSRTRSKIRRWFRQQEREQNILFGREAVRRELKRLGVSNIYSIEDIAQALNYDELDEFLARVGFGDIQSTQIGGVIARLEKQQHKDDELSTLLTITPKKKGLTVLGVGGLHTNIAQCCTPIPPEPIIGFITRGRGVTIHRQGCKQVLAMSETERFIEVAWGIDEETYAIPVVITAHDRTGLMGDIANILKAERVNLTGAKTAVAEGVATISLIMEVTGLEQLSWLLNKFENLPTVMEASRRRWS